jgi:hypothetical protein
MKAKTIMVVDDLVKFFTEDIKDGITREMSFAHLVFAKEGKKYRLLKNRYGNLGVCSKADIVDFIFNDVNIVQSQKR